MANMEIIKSNREAILKIAAKHGAKNVRIFGSVARGEDDEKSDIDFMVEMGPERSLYDRAALLLELQELMKIKVDVVTEKGINARIKNRVLNEAIPLWENTKKDC